MSPRRKSGLSPEDLQALKHLPAVLTALEHLQEQHAKVRALMGDAPRPALFRPVPGESPLEAVERQGRALDALPDLGAMGAAERLETVNQWLAEGRISKIVARRLLDVGPEVGAVPGESGRMARRRQAFEALQDPIHRPDLPQKPINPNLDTPERQDYEAAKKAGRKVPAVDPFANASPAQRERMAEQRALIDAERAARGLPTRSTIGGKVQQVEATLEADLITPDAAAAVVRTETLDTVSDGTTPLAADDDDDAEVH